MIYIMSPIFYHEYSTQIMYTVTNNILITCTSVHTIPTPPSVLYIYKSCISYKRFCDVTIEHGAGHSVKRVPLLDAHGDYGTLVGAGNVGTVGVGAIGVRVVGIVEVPGVPGDDACPISVACELLGGVADRCYGAHAYVYVGGYEVQGDVCEACGAQGGGVRAVEEAARQGVV
ncbi:hypothetical protein B484DRAFT_24418 [Ochromonadaceae sp. CCMP2298]|nr:hypothetical protein B484DRAFT_24418 [Ochromonadaceae sp. CCMP2298]